MKKNTIIYLSFFGLFYYTYSSAMEQSLQILPSQKPNIKELFSAIKKNNVDLVGTIIKESPDLIHTKRSTKRFFEEISSLHLAAQKGSVACMKVLLDNGADANCLTKGCSSPLHFVTTAKRATLLLKYGAQVNQKDKRGITPLVAIITSQSRQQFEIAQVLIDAGADINKGDKKEKNTVLHKAVDWLRLDVIDFLLRNNADPDKRNALGKSPFDVIVEAMWETTDDMRELFGKYGMIFFPGLYYQVLFQNPLKWSGAVDNSYRTVLLNNWARLFGSVKIDQKYRIKNSATMNGVIANEYGCIVKRISYKDLEQLFSKEVADHINNMLIKLCNRTLDLICIGVSIRFIEDHINEYPFVTTYDAQIANDMVSEAIKKHDEKYLAILLKNKIDCLRPIEIVKDAGALVNTFLHQAIYLDNPNVMRLLIRGGVDYMQRNTGGQTPMEYAIGLGKSKCITKLNQLLCKQFVKLFYQKNYKGCNQLLSQIIDCNMLLENGNTLMHEILVCSDNKYTNKYVIALKDKGADLNALNKQGDTPLSYVLSKFHIQAKNICELLLNAGARIDILDVLDLSVLNVAKDRKDLELVELFLRYGAIVTPSMLELEWKGTQILLEAYTKQLEISNKEVTSRCLVCFESTKTLKTIPCARLHEGSLLCDDCCQELRDKSAECPMCKKILLAY